MAMGENTHRTEPREPPPPGRRPSGSPRDIRLLWRTYFLTSAVFVAATLALVLSPQTITDPMRPGEVAVLVMGAVVVLLLNAALMRRAFAPLERLAAAMTTIDLRRPGQQVPIYGRDAEIVKLTDAFNAMLRRLEHERRSSSRAILSVEESERRRLARELHDEVGQRLTAALLHLSRASRASPDPARGIVDQASDVVRSSLESVREISVRLRPAALDDLGLRSALVALCERIQADARMKVHVDLPSPFPALDGEEELAIYRVVQEALTNVARHASARTIWMSAGVSDGFFLVAVEDDGQGFDDGAAAGTGVDGMRERALLVSGALEFARSSRGGAAVTLVLPLSGDR